MTWNFDISQAPRGGMKKSSHVDKSGRRVFQEVFQPTKLILATKCGKVTVSRYVPDIDRWLMLGEGEQPVAWMAWPEHPHSPSSFPSLAANSPALSSPSAPGSLFQGAL